jgi:hypothetical protein
MRPPKLTIMRPDKTVPFNDPLHISFLAFHFPPPTYFLASLLPSHVAILLPEMLVVNILASNKL